ncbi:MAG: glycine cleavage system protein GcvH [Gammaproteobacteria bacterium]
MSDIKFTEDHEWLKIENDGNVTVGITDYAQEQLGDIVYIELPEAGTGFEADTEMAVVESVKAAGDVKVPIAGEVVEVNIRLTDEPELVNTDPMGDGWFLKIAPEDIEEVDKLMSEAEYKDYIGNL